MGHRHAPTGQESKIEMSLGAWQAEFTTILAAGRRILPFGAILPQGGMPLLQSIRECSVTFPMFKGERFLVPHFILVFWNTQNARGQEPPKNLLEPLCFGHMGATDGIHTTTLKTGIRIVTTFRFTAYTRTASFSMREDVVQEMKASTWKVYIWRTDDWNRLTPGVDIAEGLREGQSWSDS